MAAIASMPYFIRSKSLRIGVMEIANAEVGRTDKAE